MGSKIEKDLSAVKDQTLIYAPDGQLRDICLAALFDGQQWFIERFGMNYITATSLSELNTKPASQLKVLAAAFTQGQYRFEIKQQAFHLTGLPYAGQEVEVLANTIPMPVNHNPNSPKQKPSDRPKLP